MAMYIQHAQRKNGQRIIGNMCRHKPRGDNEHLQAVREWLRANGHPAATAAASRPSCWICTTSSTDQPIEALPEVLSDLPTPLPRFTGRNCRLSPLMDQTGRWPR